MTYVVYKISQELSRDLEFHNFCVGHTVMTGGLELSIVTGDPDMFEIFGYVYETPGMFSKFGSIRLDEELREQKNAEMEEYYR